MKRYVEFIAKHRLLLTILLFISFIISANGVRQIQLGGDFDVFVPNESVYADRLEEMEQYFPSSDQMMVQIKADDMDLALYKAFAEFNSYVKSLGGMEITGPVFDDQPDDVNMQSLMMYSVFTEILGDMSPVVELDGDYYYTFTIFSDSVMTKQTIDDIEGWLDDNELEFAMSGDTYMQLKVLDYITFIITRIPPMALSILILVFFLRIRTFKGTLFSLLPAAIGSMWTMGILGYSGMEVSIVTVLAPIFTIVIGSADGLYFITHVQEEQAKGKGPIEALSHTLHMVGMPMIITTITSMVGFLTLMVMDTNAVVTLALFASIGILLAGVATWYVLPLILTGGMKLGHKRVEHVDNNSVLKRLWGKPVWAIVAIVGIIFAIGVGNVSQEFNMLSIYKKSTQVYQNIETITEVNGGALPVFIYGDMPDGSVELSMESMMMLMQQGLPEQLEDISVYEQGLLELDSVGKVVSGVGLVETLVSDPTILSNIGGMGEAGSPDIATSNPLTDNLSMLTQFQNTEADKIRMMVLPINFENKTLGEISEYVEGMNSEYADYNFKETGVGFMMRELNESMFFNQIISSLLAIGIVFLLLLISLRHVRAAAISLIPIILTLLTLFGGMGIFNISLNLISSTIFSISIGVGIDYAIHFTSVWRTNVRDGLSGREAADQAFRYTHRPILANAFGLALGFSALFLSPLAIHGTIATLMWIAMTSSVAFSLIILPTILRRIDN